MKFDKVSESVYKEFLENNANHLETPDQRKKKLDYFTNKLPMPVRKTSCSAGYDFVCPIDVMIAPGKSVIVPTGMKVQVEQNKMLNLHLRSSVAIQCDCRLKNVTGIIDSDYYNNPGNEGHIMVIIRNSGAEHVRIPQGDRFCQGIIVQYYTVENDKIGYGESRKGGMGSTGSK